MSSVDQTLLKAQGHLKRGGFKEAAHLYASILEKYPFNQRAQDGLRKLEKLGVIKLRVPSPPQDQINALISLYTKGQYHDVLQRGESLQQEYPESALLLNILGATNTALKKYDVAVLCFQKALEFHPNYAEALNNLSVVLRDLKRYEEAIKTIQKALALQPDYPEAHNNLGIICDDLKRYEDAISSYTKALQLNPKYSDAAKNLGNTWNVLKRYEEAVAAYTKAVVLNPRNAEAFAKKVHLQSHMCVWESLLSDQEKISELGLSSPSVSPFSMLAFEDNPLHHKLRSQCYVSENIKNRNALPILRQDRKHERIRVGYFSSDFYDHATMYLMAGLFEKHDKRRFSIYAYSFGPDKNDGMHQRLKKAVDVYRDVRALNDLQIADLAREDEIDIAIDLKGYTQDSRLGIFSARAAPIQINYLGYPGTLGASFMDYIIADRQVIPTEYQEYYTEKVIYLPHSYQVNDNKRQISDRSLTRSEMGLPENGFVFCCFNNNFKISPQEFDIWMRLLCQVDNSVLWLFKGNEWADRNLRKEAEMRGVNPCRLVFADKKPLGEHLARQRLADLFLDTFHYNAPTTASDALWVGFPVLTKGGQGFAARVGASLLRAIDVPELITTTKEEYEAKALELARDPWKLTALKDKLARQKDLAPLFDTALFTKHL
ncbi:MAG: tetratricopeptide repeat protein, partial [Hyphomicrobium sp.]